MKNVHCSILEVMRFLGYWNYASLDRCCFSIFHWF